MLHIIFLYILGLFSPVCSLFRSLCTKFLLFLFTPHPCFIYPFFSPVFLGSLSPFLRLYPLLSLYKSFHLTNSFLLRSSKLRTEQPSFVNRQKTNSLACLLHSTYPYFQLTNIRYGFRSRHTRTGSFTDGWTMNIVRTLDKKIDVSNTRKMNCMCFF